MRRIGEMKLKRFCLLAAIALTVVVSSAWAEPIGEVKSKPAGWSGYISGFVTAIFPDYGCMVVEEADRSAAITVRPALSLGIGTEVLILGTLQEDGTFLSSRTTPTGFVNTVSPVGMPNKAITGATGDSGLSNLDMLITTYGRVLDYRTTFPDGSVRFHISDGSATGVGPVVTLPAGGMTEVSQTLQFQDSFDSGRRPEWSDYVGATTPEGGKLKAADNTNIVCAGGLSIQDAKVDVDATAGIQMGIILRYQDPDNFVLAFFAPQSTGHIIGFHERVGGVWGDWINSVSAEGLSGTVRVEAEVQGDYSQVSITDGTRSYSTSCTLVNLLGSGLVGIYHDTSCAPDPVYFDNFRAFRLSSVRGIDSNAVQVAIQYCRKFCN